MTLTDDIVICIVASIIIFPFILIRVVREVVFLFKHIKKDKKNKTPRDAFNNYLYETKNKQENNKSAFYERSRALKLTALYIDEESKKMKKNMKNTIEVEGNVINVKYIVSYTDYEIVTVNKTYKVGLTKKEINELIYLELHGYRKLSTNLKGGDLNI